MPDRNFIIEQVIRLARQNRTTDLLKCVVPFIEENYDKFPEDYQWTSQKDRFSTGKLEKALFFHLADLCKWSNKNENAHLASSIMNNLGYHSYQLKEKRFRQKIENEKKKKRSKCLKKKSQYKRREMEDIYSESDDDTYFSSSQKTNEESTKDIVKNTSCEGTDTEFDYAGANTAVNVSTASTTYQPSVYFPHKTDDPLIQLPAQRQTPVPSKVLESQSVCGSIQNVTPLSNETILNSDKPAFHNQNIVNQLILNSDRIQPFIYNNTWHDFDQLYPFCTLGYGPLDDLPLPI